MKSVQRFPETLEAILEERGLSQRAMIRMGQERSSDPRTHGSISPILKGNKDVSIGVMRFVADALMIPPETFAEYRLWQARRLFDPSEDAIGFEAALRNLEELERRAAEVDLPLPAGWLAGRQRRREPDPKRAGSA